jgi:hypothetical protein
VALGVQKAIARFGSFDANIATLKECFITDRSQGQHFRRRGQGRHSPGVFAEGRPDVFRAAARRISATQHVVLNAYSEVFRTEYEQKPHLLRESTQALGSFFGL